MIGLIDPSSLRCWSVLDLACSVSRWWTTFFSNASTFVSVNNSLSPCILLHWSIQQGCPLEPYYLYVLRTNALGYLLEVARIQSCIQGISPLHDLEMGNNHFCKWFTPFCAPESGFNRWSQALFGCFLWGSETVVSDHKTDYWLVGLEDPPYWIPVAWNFTHPGAIVQYLGIPLVWGSLWLPCGIGVSNAYSVNFSSSKIRTSNLPGN